jgi:hypothetical protein
MGWRGGCETPTAHLHGGLDVDGAHEAVLCDAQRDLHKRRLAHAAHDRRAVELVGQAVLCGGRSG